MTASGCEVSIWGDENIPELIVVVIAELCEYTQNHCFEQFKWVNYTVCEFYLNKLFFKNNIFYVTN